jgi:hypothetical protein
MNGRVSTPELQGIPAMPATIAETLRSKLRHARPNERLRVLVVLDLREFPDFETRNRRGAQRKRIIAEAKSAADSALPDIASVLRKYGGTRLRESSDALGTIPVETTPAGVRALADMSAVQSILEDQPLTLAFG